MLELAMRSIDLLKSSLSVRGISFNPANDFGKRFRVKIIDHVRNFSTASMSDTECGNGVWFILFFIITELEDSCGYILANGYIY